MSKTATGGQEIDSEHSEPAFVLVLEVPRRQSTALSFCSPRRPDGRAARNANSPLWGARGCDHSARLILACRLVVDVEWGRPVLVGATQLPLRWTAANLL